MLALEALRPLGVTALLKWLALFVGVTCGVTLLVLLLGVRRPLLATFGLLLVTWSWLLKPSSWLDASLFIWFEVFVFKATLLFELNEEERFAFACWAFVLTWFGAVIDIEFVLDWLFEFVCCCCCCCCGLVLDISNLIRNRS